MRTIVENMVSFTFSRARLPVLRLNSRVEDGFYCVFKYGKYEAEMKKENTDSDVKVSLKEVNPCEWRADMTLPPNEVDAKLDAAAATLKDTVSIPGFRPGKAPLALLAKRFKADIASQVIRDLHALALAEIQKECPLNLVTLPMPENSPLPPQRGNEYSLTLFFETAPKFDLPDYKKLELPKLDTNDVDDEIESEIAKYRETYAEFKPLDDAKAMHGDMLKISFTSDVTVPEGAPESCAKLVAAQGAWCWLNDPEMLPGVIKCLEGAGKGEKRTLDVTFPDDFVEPALVGLSGKYEIEVIEIRRRMPVEDDGELCKKLGVEDMDALKKYLESSVRAKLQSKNRSKAIAAMFGALRKKVGALSLPPSLLAQTAQGEFSAIANEIVLTKEDVDGFQKDIETHRNEAEKRAVSRLSDFFIASAIAELESISVEQNDLDERIRVLSSFYGRKEKELRKQLEESGRMEEMHMDMMLEKVAEKLLELNGFREDGEKDNNEGTKKQDKEV